MSARIEDAKDTEQERRLAQLARDIKAWGQELGFAAVGICDVDTGLATPHLLAWLDAGRHGEMNYMQRHAHLRTAPTQLFPGAARVISARLDYRPRTDSAQWVER